MAVKKETLSYIEICNSIAKGEFSPIYVLAGEESYYIDQIEDMIVSKALTNDEKAFNLTIAYGLDTLLYHVLRLMPNSLQPSSTVISPSFCFFRNFSKSPDIAMGCLP